MSEIADTPVPVQASAPARFSSPDVQTVHEAYSFACMRCGYGWEQDYRIEHHVDGRGEPFIMYTVDGERVPSPLSNPTCMNCGGHVVRIMRAGQVSSVLGMIDHLYHHRIAPGIAGPVPAGADVPRTPKPRRTAELHDAPGPVAISEAEKRGGLFSRLMGFFRRS
ncbi:MULTISPECIES: hypothetical protein [Streptomyces]|uniref:C2H2-type domain-containing protein n=1 Tax=Streptomyces virginiae TaxID=1961 RepID=A0ABQ3NWF9_STRVG|nr:MULTISPECIES: hypothetical protein [Streptomyces]KOU15474.1 hypothetical protein ADK49_20695 [Streptomyces sp. WM6349]KOU81334.1 hypothetical protein ADK94_26855 [Streptomyces sp. XY593]KOU94203.1 hypothetical protein ADK92_22705 [Streptomyces sp. XY533]KOV44898.1 hypothetical protein ADK98_17045 [Streptomyces sp. H036]MBP2344545.1 ribosomal protein S27AE [Streptomyces virginiae]